MRLTSKSALEYFILLVSIMANDKRRKVDKENRVFKKEWTEEFITHSKPEIKFASMFEMQLPGQCNGERQYSVTFSTNHPTFNIAYLPMSEKRSNEINRLKSAVDRGRKIIDTFMSVQERATVAFLKVTWRLCRSMKPLTDAELVKKCMLDAIESVVENPSKREELMKKIEEIPLSNDTSTKRAEQLSGDVSDELKARIKKAEHIALAIDES